MNLITCKNLRGGGNSLKFRVKSEEVRVGGSSGRLGGLFSFILSVALLFGVNSVWAANVKWTGAVDNYWGNTDNWKDKDSSRPFPTNDGMYFERQYYDDRFTENEVIFDGAYVNEWQTVINDVGSLVDPLVFIADKPECGLQFGKSRHTYIGNKSPVYLQFKGGIWSTGSGANFEFGTSKSGCLTLLDGALLNVGQYLHLCGGSLIVENATVKIPTYELRLGASAYATLQLNEGGEVACNIINPQSNGGKVIFDGGTLRAIGDGALIDAHNKLSVFVGNGGGIIDANGKVVTIGEILENLEGESGGMTFKGGGSVTLQYENTYTGGTTIEGGTCVKVATKTAAEKLLGDALNVTLPALDFDVGEFPLVTITGEGEFSEKDLEKVKFAPSVSKTDGYEFALSDDSKSLVFCSLLYRGGTINQSEPKLVFPGKTLEDLAKYTLRARMQGANFEDDGAEVTFFNMEELKEDDKLTKVTYQLQAIDASHVKAAKVEFTADEFGVYAKLIEGSYSNYNNSFNTFGTDLTSNPGTSGYIPYDFRLVEPVKAISVNFAYSDGGLDTTSSARFGAGDYAVPYTSWNNMPVSPGSSAAFGGATFTQTTTSGEYRCVDLNMVRDVRYGYLDDGGLSVVVDVKDIPYEFYRVVTYHATDNDNIKFGYVTINGIDYTGVSDVTQKGKDPWGATAARNKAKGLREGVNYLVSDIMVGSNVKITGHRDKASSPTYRGSIAAIQIVESTKPTFKTTVSDGGEKQFSELVWDKEKADSFTDEDQLVVNIESDTTLVFENDVNVYAIKFNIAEGKKLTLTGGKVGSQYIAVTGGTSLTIDNDVDAAKIAYTSENSQQLVINQGKTLTIKEINGNINILNNGTLIKNGDGATGIIFNVASRGKFVVNAGTLKAIGQVDQTWGTPITGDLDGTTLSNFLIDVKSGATYDQNGIVLVSASVRLSEGAHFVNNGADCNTKWNQAVQLILSGDADVAATYFFGLIAKSYASTRLDLGSYALNVNVAENKDFMLCNTTITGEGTISVTRGKLAIRHIDSTGENCTLLIGENGIFENNVHFTIKNFMNKGVIAYASNWGRGELEVSGRFESKAASFPKLTLTGATVKATGDAVTVLDAFKASGTITIDASDITKEQMKDAGEAGIAVLTVPATATTNGVGIDWNVSHEPISGTCAKWRMDESGETKTLRLFKPRGLRVIVR